METISSQEIKTRFSKPLQNLMEDIFTGTAAGTSLEFGDEHLFQKIYGEPMDSENNKWGLAI
jgi:hypothetical protein